MAYRRRRRFYRRRRAFNRTGGSWGRFKTRKTEERKWHDVLLSRILTNGLQVVTDAGGTQSINLIPQGNGPSTRDGRKCTLLSYFVTCTIAFDINASAGFYARLKLWLIQDTQCNGANLGASSDVFDISATGNLVHRNLYNVDRFRILDTCHLLANPMAATGAGGTLNPMTSYWECQGKLSIPLEFSSSTGAISEIKSNNLFWMCCADGVATNGVTTLKLFNRLRFEG